MRYASLFAGIGCADVAWAPLEWEPVVFSEVDPFASAVLARRFPGVPNVGDVTAHDWSQYQGRVDLVVGGSPCQAFSCAGLRHSLSDRRGNLSLAFVEACNDIDPAFVLWENVPGVQSTKDNAFGCFLAGMVGASEPLQSGRRNGRWPDAGLVVGPKRAAAWGILDAQYFGVPQRRKRIFLLAVSLFHPAFAAGEVPNPAEVLFVREGVRGDSPARGEAGQEAVAPSGIGAAAGSGKSVGAIAAASFTGGAGCRPDGAAAGHFIPCVDGVPDVSGTLGGGGDVRGYRNDLDTSGAFIPCEEVVPAVTSKWAKGCGGPAGDECQNLVAVPLLEVGKRTGKSADDPRAGLGVGVDGDPMYTLQASAQHGVACAIGIDCVAFHPSQDPIESAGTTHALGCGSTKGQASVAVALAEGAVPLDLRNALRDRRPDGSTPGGGMSGREGDPAFTVTAAGAVQAVAFSSKDCGTDEAEVSPTLRAMGHDASHMNGGGQVAVATVTGDVTHTLRAEGADASEDGTGRGTPVVAIHQSQDGEVRAGKVANTLNTNSHASGRNAPLVMEKTAVRRLTPRECERLQGLPDDWTLIPYGKGRRCKDLAEFAAYLGVMPDVVKTLSADSVRYKGVGNGMAVPVIWWIGRRLEWILQRLNGGKEGAG
jgi:DNA (cytosine-5)-methyltransferase 1